MKDQALQILHQAIVPEGLLASPQPVDNYARVWSRDSMMAGIAGLLADDALVIHALGCSVTSLAEHQGRQGQLPSNIACPPGQPRRVSYGGLAGRVDASSWWIIGASLYTAHTGDANLKKQWFPVVSRAFDVLKAWEYNDRGLIYVPLGGNWADEYVSVGYTLYDQLLRYWAYHAAAVVWQSEEWAAEAAKCRQLIADNYRAGTSVTTPYHPSAYAKAEAKPYWWSSFDPSGYDTRWDMPANALALLLGIGNTHQNEETTTYLHQLATATGHWLLPVFDPVITPKSPDWKLLSENYSYQFKNHPHRFHNGGAWAIFLGWLSLGLARHGFAREASEIRDAYDQALASEQPKPYTFYEYWNPKTRIPGGTPQLGFSAAGAVFMETALAEPSSSVKLKLLLP